MTLLAHAVGVTGGQIGQATIATDGAGHACCGCCCGAKAGFWVFHRHGPSALAIAKLRLAYKHRAFGWADKIKAVG